MSIRHHKRNFEGASFPCRALDSNQTAVLFDDAIAGGQSQSRAVGFCREKGRKNLRQVLVRDAGTFVGEINPDVSIRSAVMTANMIVGFQPSSHGERAALLHGLKGVLDQIEKHLNELGPVAIDRWQARI